MKKYGFIPLLLALCLVLLLPAAAKEIGSADALTSLMNDPAAWSGDWTLTADIDLTGKTQTPIGNYGTPFTGSFDGAGHTVSGLHIAAGEAAGLFGVTEGATVRNLTVCGSVENTFAAATAETRVEGRYSGTGGIVGVALSGTTIKDCTSRASVKGYGNVGGLCGVVYNFGLATVRIDGCRSEAPIESLCGNAGGLIGRIYTASVAFPAVVVSDSVNTADQTLTAEDRNRLGGIVGYIRAEAGFVLLENCANTGSITAKNSGAELANYPFAGGILGRAELTGDATAALRVVNCKNSGAVESSKYAGGIAAYVNRAAACTDTATALYGCANSGAVTGGQWAGGILGYSESKAASSPRAAVTNCLSVGAVKAGESAGGIIGRCCGFDIADCIALGSVTAPTAGALAAKTEGAACSITHVRYADGIAASIVGAGTMHGAPTDAAAVAAGDLANPASFAGFDFETVWQMGASAPMLRESPARFVRVRAYTGNFTDVKPDEWFYDYVGLAYAYGLANGTSASAFSPRGSFTVAQALTAAANIHTAYFGTSVPQAYAGQAWYVPYVEYCIRFGIITRGQFASYDANITRGEMAEVFAAVLPASAYAARRDGMPKDVAKSLGCYDAVQKLYAAGIVGGDAGSGNYRPGDSIIRAEACVIFTRICAAAKRIGSNQT